MTSKKRQGVAHFIRHFPIYVTRIESQLTGADGLEIRTNVDAAYEKLVNTMFESLKQMAKMEGEEEDKGQLNYHVILVGKCIRDFSLLVESQLKYTNRKHASFCRGNFTFGIWYSEWICQAG